MPGPPVSSYLAVSPLPTTAETVAGGLLSVALFPDLAIGGRYPPSYPAESGLSSKERLAPLSPRPSVRLLVFSFSRSLDVSSLAVFQRRARNPSGRRVRLAATRPRRFSIIPAKAFLSSRTLDFFVFLSLPAPILTKTRAAAPLDAAKRRENVKTGKLGKTSRNQKTNELLRTRSFSIRFGSRSAPSRRARSF